MLTAPGSEQKDRVGIARNFPERAQQGRRILLEDSGNDDERVLGLRVVSFEVGYKSSDFDGAPNSGEPHLFQLVSEIEVGKSLVHQIRDGVESKVRAHAKLDRVAIG